MKPKTKQKLKYIHKLKEWKRWVIFKSILASEAQTTHFKEITVFFL